MPAGKVHRKDKCPRRAFIAPEPLGTNVCAGLAAGPVPMPALKRLPVEQCDRHTQTVCCDIGAQLRELSRWHGGKQGGQRVLPQPVGGGLRCIRHPL